MEMGLSKAVCVTGAGGYIASWLVKLLLSQNYTVHGTVRNPNDARYEHLKILEKAPENLKLFKADILNYESLSAAIKGCGGVFHVASPVPPSSVAYPEAQLMEPAVKGTLNVLKACSEANVKRAVFLSSVVAVSMDPNWPAGEVMDETCWSDTDHCKRTNNWYFASKTEAEIQAFEYAKTSGLDVVSVLPTLVWGPLMQPSINTSNLALISLLKEGYESTENKRRSIVDVRDVVAALLQVYEKPEAEGRYICAGHEFRVKELVDKLRSIYPDYKYPKVITGLTDGGRYSSMKLQRLGWSCRTLEETLVDAIESYKKFGLLD